MKLTRALLAGGIGSAPKWGYKFKPGMVYGILEDRVRSIVIYRISPFEQRAFATVLANFSNTIRRVFNACFVLPYFFVTYAYIKSSDAEYGRLCRKNPDDYKQFYETTGDPVKYKTGKIIRRKWPK